MSIMGQARDRWVRLSMCYIPVALLAVGAVQAGDLIITSITGNGVVSWSDPTNGVAAYRVEWIAEIESGRWTDLNQGIQDITPTAGVMSAEVPMCFRVKAIAPAPTNMVYIPPGPFIMGNAFPEDMATEAESPRHLVYVSGFYIDRYEVGKALWDEIYSWATNNSYAFRDAAGGKDTNHPAHSMNWYDAVKWCNARSEREGLAPCYYTDTNRTTAYRSGELDLQNSCVDWDANGYRLPTEAEWEKAARGGSSGYRFPWPDDKTSHGRANYESDMNAGFDLSSPGGYHPAYTNGGIPYTSPVGSFTPNGYGLYDVSGNVWEWCWDWFGSYSDSTQNNPAGPTSGSERVLRSGGYNNGSWSCRVACRWPYSPTDYSDNMGFRSVRR